MSINREAIYNSIFDRCLLRIKSISIIVGIYRKDKRLHALRRFPEYSNILRIFQELIFCINTNTTDSPLYDGSRMELIDFAQNLVERHPIFTSKSVSQLQESSCIYEFVKKLQNIVVSDLRPSESDNNSIEPTAIDNQHQETEAIANEISAVTSEYNALIQRQRRAMEEHSQRLKDLISNCNENCRKRCIESDKKLETLRSTFVQTFNIANSENEQLKEELANAIQTTQLNLEKSRKLLSDKQHELKDIIERYDAEVGTRRIDLMQRQEHFDNEKREFDKWMKEFDDQEIIYNTVMNEMAIEHEQQVLTFVENRSARIIQRKFRQMLARKKAKNAKRRKPKRQRK